MNVILCLDNDGGMLFNNRRQSKDIEVIKDIFKSLSGQKLFINSFSLNLFENYKNSVTLKENLLESTKDEICFVENLSLKKSFEKIDKITVYSWNRNYPFDFKCDLDFSRFKILDETEFVGKSHEKITKKIYVRA